MTAAPPRPAGSADAPSTDLVGEFAERAVDVVIDVVTAAAASTAAGRRDRARRVVVQQVTTTHQAIVLVRSTKVSRLRFKINMLDVDDLIKINMHLHISIWGHSFSTYA